MKNRCLGRLLSILFALPILSVLSGCPTTTELPSILITAEGSDTALMSGGAYSFGDVAWGETKAVTFTITNNGTADLTLTTEGLVAVSGTDAALFTLTALPALTVVPVSGTATFTVTFAPVDVGVRAAMVTIATDYETDPILSFMLSGSGVKGWRTVGTAGFSSGAVTDVSLAIDQADGTPYVAYIDASLYSGYPVVQKLSSGTWGAMGDAGYYGVTDAYVSTSLCIAEGCLWLAYSFNVQNYGVDVRYYSTEGWTDASSFRVSGQPDQYISLRSDMFNNIYAAFRDNASDLSGYATLYSSYINDGSWGSYYTGFTSEDASYISLGLMQGDSTYGIPYIAFKNDTSGKANVYYPGEGMMPYGDSDFSDGTADYTSLAIDSNDVVYVAYADGAQSGKVTVMKNADGGTWSAVGSKGFSAGAASYVNLACDRNDTLYVAYKDGGNSGKLTVQKYNGTSWETVGAAGFSGDSADYVSLAFYYDTPYVAFRDGAASSRITVMKLE